MIIKKLWRKWVKWASA